MMPADPQSAPLSATRSYPSLIGLIVTAISLAGLSLVLSRIGVEPISTIVFAAISACAVGAFVSRERSLVYKLALAERQHLAQLGLEAERLDELYSNSVTCLVMFDAGTHMINRVSAGFLELLGLSVNGDLEADIAGARLEEVLSVNSMRLANVVYQIKMGTMHVRENLECKRSDGKSVTLLFSGRYLPHLHRIEAAFYQLPQKATELADYERVMGDLERFKKGIVRRESRVLELKGEVNELLRQQSQTERYQVDATSDDSRFVQKILSKKAVEHQ